MSKIILGCMSYGSPEWQDWVLSEEEGIKHIKAAYDAGIQTFDTAGVCRDFPHTFDISELNIFTDVLCGPVRSYTWEGHQAVQSPSR